MRYYTKPQNTLKWKTGRYNSEIKFNTDSIFLVDALISKTVYDYKFFNVSASSFSASRSATQNHSVS